MAERYLIDRLEITEIYELMFFLQKAALYASHNHESILSLRQNGQVSEK